MSLLLLNACGKPKGLEQRSGLAAAVRRVRVVPAELRPMERAIPVTGTLAAQEQSTLSTKVSGRLQRIPVDVGTLVRTGDVIAQVEPRDYELAVQQAAAALAQARATLGLPLEGADERVNLESASAVKQAKAVLNEAGKNRERVLNLNKAGIAPTSELDTAEANYTVALARYDTALEEARMRVAALAERHAEYEIAKKRLEDSTIRAPFDGAIQERPASLGEYVAAGTPIVRLVKIDPLRLRLEVAERESALVHAGQVVRLMIDGNTNVYDGRITRLSPAINETNRMLLVEADIPQKEGLRPGLYARAEIIVNERQQGLAVPLNALVTFAGIEKVIVVKNGQTIEKNVMTGRRGPGWVEIISGLAPGENVALDPSGLRTGQRVEVTGQPVSSQISNTSLNSGQ